MVFFAKFGKMFSGFFFHMPFIRIRSWRQGFTTLEVMVMLVAMSLVVLSAYGAQVAAFQAYREQIHRERAQLYAAETLEELEAKRLTEIHKNYQTSWKQFLGGSHHLGSQRIVRFGELSELEILSVTDSQTIDESSGVRIYEAEDGSDGMFTRLERRIVVTDLSDSSQPDRIIEKRLVQVSIYWGIPGQYAPESLQQIIVQAIYADHRGPGAAI